MRAREYPSIEFEALNEATVGLSPTVPLRQAPAAPRQVIAEWPVAYGTFNEPRERLAYDDQWMRHGRTRWGNAPFVFTLDSVVFHSTSSFLWTLEPPD